MRVFLTFVLWYAFLAKVHTTSAQQYTVAGGYISFYSSAPLEDIQAVNQRVSSLFNSTSGEIAFSVPVNGFEFKKKLMQEHFNEKYLESEKFPRATFTGRISGYDASVSGLQTVQAVGKLTIHGVTRKVNVPGTIARQGENLIMKSKFTVRLEDYSVSIPKILRQNIAQQVEVTVDLVFKPR
ncbi:MAG: hypothetical protein KatS3mg032_0304 [Cyclobacteriaceae bacterium]|nr:MAG: hypothetical protein KatS3mg032_0304 [Cyclobacteriaceae bacterium]